MGKVGDMNYVAGWGLTKHEGEISLTLKEAAVPLVKYDECNSIDSYEGEGAISLKLYLTRWFPPRKWWCAYHFEPRLREF